jgi:hypothetical protein
MKSFFSSSNTPESSFWVAHSGFQQILKQALTLVVKMKNKSFRQKTNLTSIIILVSLSIFVSAAVFAQRGTQVNVLERDNMVFILGRSAIARFDLGKGTFDMIRTSGEMVVQSARAEAVVSDGGKKITLSSAGAADVNWYYADIDDKHGKGIEVTITSLGGAGVPSLSLIFRAYENRSFFIITACVNNTLGRPIGVEKVSPIVVTGESGGGVFLGMDPAKVTVIENGHKNQFDFWVRLVDAPAGADSNWSAALYDAPSGRSLVGGFLSQNQSLGSVLVTHDASKAVTDNVTGRVGISGYHARSSFSPIRKLDPKKQLASDPFFIDFGWDAPFDSLELFAEHSGIENGVKPRDIKIPIFWDTWYSHYNDGISEQIVLENLAAAADKLVPYGLNTFEIDAGWQNNRGDWQPNERFPRGMKFIADGIREKGLMPGIWIAPFLIEKGSSVYTAHPDWALDLDTYGQSLIPKNVVALDISNPAAREWLRGLVCKLTSEWGFKLLKVDFTYYSLAGTKYFVRGRSRVEIFRDAYQLMRDAAGPDVYILAVGVPVGVHVGLVDAMRTGLDNAPRWGAESGYATQGTLPSYRNMTRRYFLNGAVWMNDPDAIYTGMDATSKRWNAQPQPRNELLAWISAVGLMGQIVELADPPAELDADGIKLASAVMPVYKRNARPLDLFSADAPETLDLKIEEPFGNWHVAGIFNWGGSAAEGSEDKDAAREIYTPFVKLGLPPNSEFHVYDFWNDKYLGLLKLGFTVKLPPRSVSVVSIREPLDHPQFLATNRHITQGATDIQSIEWEPEMKTLKGAQHAVAGFSYHLAFHVPEGWKYASVLLSSGHPSTSISDDGRILNLFFIPDINNDLTWELKFSKAGN